MINSKITLGTIFIFFSLFSNEQERWLGDFSGIYWIGIKLFFIIFSFSLLVKSLITNKVNLHKFHFPIIIIFFIGSLSIEFFDKIQTLIFIFSMIYIYWAYLSSKNIIAHFNLFINFSVLISLFAIFQELLFLFTGQTLLIFDKHIFFNSIIRVNSVFSEPSHLGLFLLPSVYIAIRSFVINDYILISSFKSRIVVTAFLLSISTSAILGLFLVFIFILKEIGFRINKKILLYSFLFIMATVFSFNNLFLGKIFEAFDSNAYLTKAVTTSGRAYFIGLFAIIETINNNFLFGYGFENYFEAVKSSNFIQSFPLLAYFEDKGHSFGYGRIFVEFGLIGFFILIITAYYNYNWSNDFTIEKVINISSLLFLSVTLFKIGHFKFPLYWYMLTIFFLSRKNIYSSIKV